MRRITIAVAVMVVVASLSTVCLAQGVFYGMWEEPAPERGPVPSWYGSTGLIVTPTALICPPHQVQGYVHQMEFDMKNQTIYGANVGLTPNLEVGVTRINNIQSRDPGPITYVDETIMNVKYRVDVGRWFNNPLAPEVALGVWDWANDLNRAYYLVMSKQVPLAEETMDRQMNLHLGIGNTDRDSGPLDGIFLGVELVPMKNGLLQLEYDGDDLNGALRYYVAPWVSLDMGIVSDDFGWGASVNTNF